jgi:hypothetical protein
MLTRKIGTSLLLLSLAGFLAHARVETRYKSDSLRGLRGAYVSVQYGGTPHREAGLTSSQIAAEVSLRLRIAGLNVLTESEWRQEPGRPYLYVNIAETTIPGQGKADLGQVYTCSVDLMQETSLMRSPGSAVDACTWSRGATIIVPPNDLGQVRVLVGDLATEFTAAARAANRPGGEATSSRSLEK